MDYSPEAINMQQQPQHVSQQQLQQQQSPPQNVSSQLPQPSTQQSSQQAPQQLLSPTDSDGGVANDWCIPHFGDDCPQRSNLLFGCVSSADSLANAFVLVQFNQFQQIVNVYTLDAPSDVHKVTYPLPLPFLPTRYVETLRGVLIFC